MNGGENLFIQIICEWCVLSCRDETRYALEIEALDEGPVRDVEDEIYGEGDIQNVGAGIDPAEVHGVHASLGSGHVRRTRQGREEANTKTQQ